MCVSYCDWSQSLAGGISSMIPRVNELQKAAISSVGSREGSVPSVSLEMRLKSVMSFDVDS